MTATVVEAANGGDSWVSLTRQAPSAGTYVFSFVLSSFSRPTTSLQNNE